MLILVSLLHAARRSNNTAQKSCNKYRVNQSACQQSRICKKFRKRPDELPPCIFEKKSKKSENLRFREKSKFFGTRISVTPGAPPLPLIGRGGLLLTYTETSTGVKFSFSPNFAPLVGPFEDQNCDFSKL